MSKVCTSIEDLPAMLSISQVASALNISRLRTGALQKLPLHAHWQPHHRSQGPPDGLDRQQAQPKRAGKLKGEEQGYGKTQSQRRRESPQAQ